jgi:hypothetical protein
MGLLEQLVDQGIGVEHAFKQQLGYGVGDTSSVTRVKDAISG